MSQKLAEPWRLIIPGVDHVFDRNNVPPIADTAALIQDWANELQGTEQPEIIPYKLVHGNAKWAILSLLQKAIRRSEPEWARVALSVCFNSGLASTAWRRLCIIGMEDCGLGCMPATMIALAMVNKKLVIAPELEFDLAMAVALMMVHNTKDRTLCDIACVLEYKQPRLQAISEPLADLGPDDWAKIMQEEQSSIMLRVLAHQKLAKKKAASDLLWQAYRDMKLPASVLYCCLGHQEMAKDPMWTGLPIAWELATRGNISEDKMAIQPSAEVVDLPGCVFDMFVSDGKRAMSYFKKSYAPIGDFLKAHPEATADALSYAVFEAEGGCLERSLAYPDRDHIAVETLEDGFGSVGLTIEAAAELVELVSNGLVELDKVRQKVITSPIIEKV
jgi:hypothetical protein